MAESLWPSLETLTIRGELDARIFFKIRLVKRNGPTWLVANWRSRPSSVLAYGQAMMPALFTSTSIYGTSAQPLTVEAAPLIWLIDSRSSCKVRVWTLGLA